jgi:hypothetical protein
VDWDQLLLLALILVLGPWGVALALALVRGYDLTITLTRRGRDKG